MARVTLTFDLPDEEEQAADAMRAPDYRAALSRIDELARSVLKHGEGAAALRRALEQIRAEAGQWLWR